MNAENKNEKKKNVCNLIGFFLSNIYVGVKECVCIFSFAIVSVCYWFSKSNNNRQQPPSIEATKSNIMGNSMKTFQTGLIRTRSQVGFNHISNESHGSIFLELIFMKHTEQSETEKNKTATTKNVGCRKWCKIKNIYRKSHMK